MKRENLLKLKADVLSRKKESVKAGKVPKFAMLCHTDNTHYDECSRATCKHAKTATDGRKFCNYVPSPKPSEALIKEREAKVIRIKARVNEMEGWQRDLAGKFNVVTREEGVAADPDGLLPGKRKITRANDIGIDKKVHYWDVGQAMMESV